MGRGVMPLPFMKGDYVMSASGQTTHYGLPQYIGSDKINPMVDTNEAYRKIDNAIYQASQGGGGGGIERFIITITNIDSSQELPVLTIDKTQAEIKNAYDNNYHIELDITALDVRGLQNIILSSVTYMSNIIMFLFNLPIISGDDEQLWLNAAIITGSDQQTNVIYPTSIIQLFGLTYTNGFLRPKLKYGFSVDEEYAISVSTHVQRYLGQASLNFTPMDTIASNNSKTYNFTLDQTADNQLSDIRVSMVVPAGMITYDDNIYILLNLQSTSQGIKIPLTDITPLGSSDSAEFRVTMTPYFYGSGDYDSGTITIVNNSNNQISLSELIVDIESPFGRSF